MVSKVVNNFFMGLEIWFEVGGWGSLFLKLLSVRDSLTFTKETLDLCRFLEFFGKLNSNRKNLISY